MKTIRFHYRGLIERGSRNRWVEGYSEGEGDAVIFPWKTRRECQAQAKRDGAEAIFVRAK